MSRISFPIFLENSPFILGEGAAIERLRRNGDLELDPYLVNSAFIYEDAGRAALETICRQYLDIGFEFGVPLLMSTPSCRGDAYNPAEALAPREALEFHAWQAGKLADAGVDFLLAATLPALSEATGLALALAATGQPYILSFIVRPEGTLLDGTPLKDAVAAIDAAATPPPLAYMINCTHATFARAALLHGTNSSPLVRRRMIGLLANTAALSPEDLNDSAALVEEDPELFGESVAGLQRELGLKILGGCCGTDGRHIRSLAARLAAGM